MPRFSLKPLPQDPRDFSAAKLLGAATLTTLQKNFSVGNPLDIKNQGETLACTACASTEAAQIQGGQEYSESFQFMLENQADPGAAKEGTDLRTAMKVATEKGFLPRVLQQYALAGDPIEKLVDPGNWKNLQDLLTEAARNTESAYASIDGPYDAFDNIRSALWQNQAERRAVMCGVQWRSSWMSAPGGLIPFDSAPVSGGHAYPIFGWVTDDSTGIVRLWGPNSYGPNVGNQGIMYFPREVVNRDFLPSLGAFTFLGITKRQAQILIHNNLSVDWVLLAQILERVERILKQIVV